MLIYWEYAVRNSAAFVNVNAGRKYTHNVIYQAWKQFAGVGVMSEFNNFEKTVQCICGQMAADILRKEEAREKWDVSRIHVYYWVNIFGITEWKKNK